MNCIHSLDGARCQLSCPMSSSSWPALIGQQRRGVLVQTSLVVLVAPPSLDIGRVEIVPHLPQHSLTHLLFQLVFQRVEPCSSDLGSIRLLQHHGCGRLLEDQSLYAAVKQQQEPCVTEEALKNARCGSMLCPAGYIATYTCECGSHPYLNRSGRVEPGDAAAPCAEHAPLCTVATQIPRDHQRCAMTTKLDHEQAAAEKSSIPELDRASSRVKQLIPSSPREHLPTIKASPQSLDHRRRTKHVISGNAAPGKTLSHPSLNCHHGSSVLRVLLIGDILRPLLPRVKRHRLKTQTRSPENPKHAFTKPQRS